MFSKAFSRHHIDCFWGQLSLSTLLFFFAGGGRV